MKGTAEKYLTILEARDIRQRAKERLLPNTLRAAACAGLFYLADTNIKEGTFKLIIELIIGLYGGIKALGSLLNIHVIIFSSIGIGVYQHDLNKNFKIK